METKKYNFLRTTFPDTAEQLIKLGYELVSKSGNTWTFYNKGTEYLQFFDDKKVVPTNIYYA